MSPLARLKKRTHALLRSSERYTKTDMVYVASGGSWLLLERVVVVAVGFGLAVAFANLLPPETYGVYKYVLSMINVAGAFSLAGLITAVNQAVSRGYEGALVSGFRTSLRWSVGVILISFGIALYYFLRDNQTLAVCFLIGGTFAPIIASAGLYDNFLSGSLRFGAKAVYGIFRNTVAPVLLVLTLFFTQEPIILIAVYFVSTALANFLCYADVLHRYRPHDQVDDATLSYSKHLSILNVLAVLAAQADRILIFTLLGGTALAVYSFAEAVPDQIRSLNSVLHTLTLPKAAARPLAELKQTIHRRAAIILLGTAGVAGAYAMIAPWFFSVFFPAYQEAVPYSQAYALVILSMPTVLYSSTLMAHMRKRELYIQRFATSGSKLILLAALIPLFAIWGAVIAVLVSYAISAVLYLWQFARLRVRES